METLTDVRSSFPVKPADQVLARRLPGGAVLVHLTSNQIFELNDTGAMVWELLGEGLAREQMLRRLVDEFDVTEAQAAVDLDEILQHFAREGLLSLP